MKVNKNHKTAYVIVALIMIASFVVYCLLNYHFRLPDECQKIPHIICVLGAVAVFCVNRRGND